MKSNLIKSTKPHWGLPIPPPPTYRPCAGCGGPVIFNRCDKCQPVTAEEIRLAEEAEQAAEREAAEHD